MARIGAPKQVEPVSLEYARQAALALEEAKDHLRDAMILAENAGNSTNQIALAVGFSNGWVRKVIDGNLPKKRPGGAW